MDHSPTPCVIIKITELLSTTTKSFYIQTGSTAKGTAIKGKSDVDLVFLLSRSRYQSVDHLNNDLKEILAHIKGVIIGKYQNVQVHQRAVSFETVCRESGTGHSHVISVDLLPAVNFGDLGKDNRLHIMRNN